MAPPWNPTKQMFLRNLLKILWIKQNQIFQGLIQLISLYFLLQVMFGGLGESQIR
jgi:hypothetical protein